MPRRLAGGTSAADAAKPTADVQRPRNGGMSSIASAFIAPRRHEIGSGGEAQKVCGHEGSEKCTVKYRMML